jgi:hypothetical protein
LDNIAEPESRRAAGGEWIDCRGEIVWARNSWFCLGLAKLGGKNNQFGEKPLWGITRIVFLA